MFKLGIIFSTSPNVSVFEQRASIGGGVRDEGAAKDQWIDERLIIVDLPASAPLPQTSLMHRSSLGGLRAGF